MVIHNTRCSGETFNCFFIDIDTFLFRFLLNSWGLNWGFAYELPTNTTYFKNVDIAVAKEKRSLETRAMMQRRHRRDLFNKMEIVMNE